MRHLGSIVLSLLLAPIVYVLTGVGMVKSLEAVSADSTRTRYSALAVALVAIAVAGLLYSVLTLVRLSPLGPVLAGLALFTVTVWAVVSTSSFQNAVPHSVFGVRGAVTVPAAGVAALLAVPLLATIVSPRRWRRHDYTPAAVAYSSESPTYSYSDLDTTRRF
jgi:hypothetical protein